MLGQLGALAGVAGGGLGLKNPNDLYIGMLKSRTVADALIEQFKLQELYDEDTLVKTREELEKNTSLTSVKDGLIVIEVEDESPPRAADMANAYVEQLIKLTQNLAISEASQRRLFFEQQLVRAKDELSKAEVLLRKTQEKTGMIALDEQGKATIEAAAMLRAQVTAKEVEMAAMRTFATDANPDYRRTQEELIGLRAQLGKIERNTEKDSGDLLISTKNIPAAGLEFARRLRDVKYYETVFELMAKQFEMAKVDEARDAAVIQVVDHAVPADYKTRPKRSLIIIMTAFIVGIGCILLAFILESLQSTREDPESRDRLTDLRKHLSPR
jgi:tyrosine-protein kinase Etk/Wzc